MVKLRIKGQTHTITQVIVWEVWVRMQQKNFTAVVNELHELNIATPEETKVAAMILFWGWEWEWECEEHD